MKHFIITLIAILLTATLCSCGTNGVSNNAEDNSDISLQSAIDETDDESEQGTSMRDKLMTYQVEINDNLITVPCAYSQLEALGYSLPEDDELNANTYTIGTYLKNADDDSLHVQFWNGSTEKKKYTECEVCQIEITFDNNLDVKLPGGITFDENLTPEQILETYGEADFDNDQEDYRSLHYEDGGFKSVEFMLYKTEELRHRSTLTINHIAD